MLSSNVIGVIFGYTISGFGSYVCGPFPEYTIAQSTDILCVYNVHAVVGLDTHLMLTQARGESIIAIASSVI